MVCVCFNTGTCESQQVSGEIIQGFPKNFKKKKKVRILKTNFQRKPQKW